MTLVKDYIEFKKEVQMKADKTIKAYQSDLRESIPALFNCSQDELTLEQLKEIKPKQVVDVFKGMMETLAPTTVNRRLVCFKDFYKYYSNIHGFPNVMANLSKFNDTRMKSVECIAEDSMQQVLNLARGTSKRDYYILTMLYGLGLRSNEFLSITKEMIFDDFILVEGKGGKLRKVPMNDTVKGAISDYLTERGNHNGLMLSMSYQGLRKLFTRYNAKVGIDCSRIHTSRHSTATNLLSKGVKLETVSSILGHASTDITMNHYVNNDIEMINAVKVLG